MLCNVKQYIYKKPKRSSLAYFLRGNVHVIFFMANNHFFGLPNVVLFSRRFIPESVRWLLVKGKTEKAREILTNVAKVNKKEMPSGELRVPVTSGSKGVFELFKTWHLAKLSLIQCYAWSVPECHSNSVLYTSVI